MLQFVIAKRFWKYVVSSVLSVGIDFGLLFLFVELFSMHYLTAATTSFILGHSTNYLISRHWNFNGTDRKHKIAYFLFVGFGAASLGMTLLLLKIFVDDAGFNYLNARLLAGCIIGVINFLFNYYVTFKAHLIPEDVDKFHKPRLKKRKK